MTDYFRAINSKWLFTQTPSVLAFQGSDVHDYNDYFLEFTHSRDARTIEAAKTEMDPRIQKLSPDEAFRETRLLLQAGHPGGGLVVLAPFAEFSLTLASADLTHGNHPKQSPVDFAVRVSQEFWLQKGSKWWRTMISRDVLACAIENNEPGVDNAEWEVWEAVLCGYQPITFRGQWNGWWGYGSEEVVKEEYKM
jgi:hypothetical protein